MAYIEMKGPYLLTEKNIDENVSESIGNYALGYTYTNDNGVKKFHVQYVGRSDTNLNQRLKDHLEEGFAKFMFFHSKDVKTAYYEECDNYHVFNPEFNEIHPRKPDGQGSLKCPVCKS